jgi:hypothetical protein
MRVANHIAARIAVGDLPAEARLPAEQDLAGEYAVANGTARRAVPERNPKIITRWPCHVKNPDSTG